MTRAVVGLLAIFALLCAPTSARASSVSGLTVDNSSPTQAAGARTVYKISFTGTGGIPALGTITVGLPTGTDFSGYNNSSVVDVSTGAKVGSCGGADTQTFTVTCGLFAGQSVPAGHGVAVTLNGVANSSTAGVLTVTTTGDADPASTAVGIAASNAVANAAVDNASPTLAARARTVYALTFTTSATGGLSNAANSRVTLVFPSGTAFDGYNNSNVVDGGVSVGSCGGANTTTFTITCSLFGGESIAGGDTVTVTLNGISNPPAGGTVTLSTSSDTAAAPSFSVATAHPVTGASVDNTSPTTAAGARTVYSIAFAASATGGLSNAANSRITLVFPSGTAFDGYNNSNVVDGGVSVGSCGGANTTTFTITCSLFGGESIAAGDTVTVTLNGISNPPAGGTVTLSTSSDTAAAPSFGVSSSQPLTNAAVNNTSPTIAAGGRTVYSITFTTSSRGGLANAANSRITLVFPSGTAFDGYNNSKVVDGGVSVGSCGGANTRTFTITCSLFGGESIAARNVVQVVLNGIGNPPASGAVAVSTTSDTTVAPSFAVAPAGALSGLTTTVGTAAPGAATPYTIDFKTSSVGALANAANSVITLVFASGTGFTGYNSSSVVDTTAGSGNIGSCGGPNLSTLSVSCSLFGGQDVPAGHVVRVTLGNVTNPPGGGPYAVAVSTTSDPGPSGPPPGQGGGQGTPTPQPTVTPTPTPQPTVTPTPTPTVSPTPVAGKTVVAVPVKGVVRIRLRGTNKFILLDGTQGIPNGSTVDTKHGTVQLTALQKVGGKPQTATFFAGIFKLTQTRKTTDLTLNQALAPCRKKGHAAAAAAKRKAKPKTRKLWGNGHGSFRTKGRYSAATVRGTKWLVQDTCAGTLTRVARGVVSVRDNVRHKTITLRAGKRYLARPRR